MAGDKEPMGLARFSICQASSGDWVVVDQGRNDVTVASCADAIGAELIAALMNGDLTALAEASAEAVSRCHKAIGGALRVPRQRARPAVGAPFVLALL